MRIGIDITSLFDQYKNRGIGNYTRELTKRLIQNKEHTWVLFGYEDKELLLKELEIPELNNLEYISFGKPKNSTFKNIYRFRKEFLPQIRKADLDIYFAPHFERGLPIGYVRTIVTMHDLIPYLTNSYSQRGKIHNFIKGQFYKYNLNKAKKAEHILTNSDFSKSELVEKGGFNEALVTRTYLGIKDAMRKENITTDKRIIRRTLMMYKITQPYLLYYGGLESNKNVASIVEAFTQLTNKYLDLKLVIAGGSFKVGWDSRALPQTKPAKELLNLIDNLKIRHKVTFTGIVDERHLPLIMANAKAYINLSTYEGFGLSVTEALASGTSLIAANSSCYPEVLKDAAILVAPDNPTEIAKQIKHLFDHEKENQQLINKGLRLSEKYNWNDCTQETLRAIESTGTQFKPLKIGYLLPYFYPMKGGAENNAYEIAKRMAKIGHEVTVFTSNDKLESLPANEKVAGMNIVRLKRITNSYYLGFYPKLIWVLLKTKIDILHVHGFGFIWHDFCLIIKKLLHPRTIIINTPHGPFMAHGHYTIGAKILKFIYRVLQRFFLNIIYKAVIAVNPTQHEWITKYGIRREKIYFIANGIDEDLFTKLATTEIKKIYNLEKSFVISYTGRFEEYKGLGQLLEALAVVVKKEPHIKLLAMGMEGNYLESIEKKVLDLELKDHVEILINCDFKTRDQVLQASDLFVLPSRWEAFGISILEAMAKHCAVITTNTEGGKYLIEDGVNGFLYEYDDIHKLAELIMKLSKDKNLLSEMQSANFKKSHQFLWSNIINDYNLLISKLYRDATK